MVGGVFSVSSSPGSGAVLGGSSKSIASSLLGVIAGVGVLWLKGAGLLTTGGGGRSEAGLTVRGFSAGVLTGTLIFWKLLGAVGGGVGATGGRGGTIGQGLIGGLLGGAGVKLGLLSNEVIGGVTVAGGVAGFEVSPTQVGLTVGLTS